MWDVTKGRDLNVGPTGAEAAHNGSLLCDLFSQQHPEAYCGCFKKIENYGQGNQLIPKTIADTTRISRVLSILPSVID